MSTSAASGPEGERDVERRRETLRLCDDLEPLRGQDAAREVAEDGVVVDDEHGEGIGR